VEPRSLSRNADAYDRFAKAVDVPMMVITILWLPVLILPLVMSVHGTMNDVFVAIDFMVWALFAIEYVVKLYLAPERWHFVRTHVLDLIIVVVPFFRPLRAARLVRLQVLGRLFVVGGEGLRRIKQVFTHKGFHFVVLFAALLVFLCAGLVTLAERNARAANIHEFGQGLWWAIVTVTTVGYGDRYPVTPMGQGVAVVLMLAGIGLIGALTATVASYFVEQKADEEEDRLDRIELLLELLVELHVPGGLAGLNGKPAEFTAAKKGAVARVATTPASDSTA
jgi:voltage-gated potassium channel